ncbi:enoyl-CoA hydratase/isomerase family protein [Cucumibacter marinus]|uniref:enoyl-CoA hydratase/isomerase family protein n=1 Tax=Cucumibacter marinus TaxID=1121252 RepID=UPI0003FE53C4|nr:enoyl-CoA hydratase-related protein [Cucumibacter marinus]
MTTALDIADGIATVTLNRPEALNAIDPETQSELAAIWARIDSDPAIRVGIVTGAGNKAFSTGADLKKTRQADAPFAASIFGDEPDFNPVDGMDIAKPMIAAINGYALGGGLEMALACDIRIASENARFGLPEVTVGTIPGAGGTQRFARIVGQSNAMRMLLTGDIIEADEALRIGLVSAVVAPGQLIGAARDIATRIAANAPLAVRAVKRLALAGADMSLDAGLMAERQAWGLIRDTEDRAEGRAAFAEKRSPEFKGR